VAHACDPSYPGDGDQEEGLGSRPAQAKSEWDPISISELALEACASGPSYVGGCRDEDHGLRPSLAKHETYLKITTAKDGLGAWFKWQSICLGKWKARSSNSSSVKKQNKKPKGLKIKTKKLDDHIRGAKNSRTEVRDEETFAIALGP
jgi:hypothetical protein